MKHRSSFWGGTLVAWMLAGSAWAASLPSSFSEQTFSGISMPTTLAIAPDGRVFVSQQCGVIRVIKNGALLSTPFATISVSCSDERGLHGIAFDPDFATNGYVYIRYTRSSPLNNVIGRLEASSTNPDVATSNTPTVLFVVPFFSSTQRYHHGGGLLVGGDGKLYSSFGDHTSGSGQDLNNLWGKVVRINVNGTIPTDNPFYATTTGDNRAIWAYGFRNPFTMAIQPGTGRIHVNDVGNNASTGREEVNVLARGANFDWPDTEGPGSFFNYAAASLGGNAIVGGTFYNPQTVMFPSTYVGKYFFGDYGGGWIRYINGSGTAGSLTSFASGITQLTDCETHPDGSLWYTSRGSNTVGRIRYDLAVTPTPTPTSTPPGPTPTPTPTLPPNTPPSAAISAPPVGTLYTGGQTHSFAGSCTDPEDGTVPASGFFWDIVFHHRSDGGAHTHPGVQFGGVAGGSFETPADGEWDPDQWWRINLTCTDSGGASHTVFRDVLPQKRTLTLETSPGGLQVKADGVTGASPLVMDAVAGMKRILDTGAPQVMGGVTYYFAGWSDGGRQTHDLSMPNADTSLTASFGPASAYAEITPPASGVTASTSDANVAGNTVDNDLATRWSGNGNGAWIQYDLGSVRSVGHVAVAVYNGNSRRNRFDLQVSNDAAVWTTVLSPAENSGTTTSEEVYDFADVSARYVRYLGHGNIGTTNPTMNSVTEVSIFGLSAPTPTPTPTPVTPTPTPTPVIPTPTPTVTPIVPTATPTPTLPPADVNITPAGTAVTASTNDGNVPANAVDGSLATRWSGNGDGAWLQLDLGVEKTVSYVKIAFYSGNLRTTRFDIQCSNGGGIWTDLATSVQSNGTSTSLETFDFADGSCRWVRYMGHGNSVNLWNSLAEVQIWQAGAAPPPTPTPTSTPIVPTPTPTATVPGISEITPGAAGVTASTSDANVPGNVVDNNLGTRWSGNGDGAWLQLDLGTTQTVSYLKVAVHQGSARTNTFDIQVSSGGTWATVWSGQSSGTTTNEETYDFADVPARYVRYVGHGSSATTFNSVAEISVFGYACSSCPTPAPPTPTPTPGTGPTLVWSDEFGAPAGTPIDSTKWKHDVGGGGWGNAQLEYDTNRTSNASHDGNGNLSIVARRETFTGTDGVTRSYTSARITTAGKLEHAYGRFEARIKLPVGQGIWPAFWMLGNDFPTVDWPTCGEIDIMENLGHETGVNHGSLHGPGYFDDTPMTATYTLPGGQRFTDAFHTFAIEWEPTAIRWYVDGNLFQTRTPASLPAGSRWVFDHPFFIILNVAVGGSWGGNPDGSTVFPQTMLVDYVRVYRLN